MAADKTKMKKVKEIVKRMNTELGEELEELLSAKRQKFESKDEPINQEETVTTSVQEINGSNPSQETCSPHQGTSKVAKIPTNNSGKGIKNRLPQKVAHSRQYNPIRRLEFEDDSSP